MKRHGNKVFHLHACEPVSRARGFTLLEVLVAMAILVTAVTLVLQVFSAGQQGLLKAEDSVAATVRAETRLREILLDEKLQEGAWSEAAADGYRFDVTVVEVLKDRTETLSLRMLDVSLTARWQRGAREKTLTLHTSRLAARIAPVTNPENRENPFG
jgi:prepilin-type N-terminal cleavage/methylation domain-containing protein